MRERYLLGMTAVPFVVAAFLPGALLAGNEVTRFEDPEIVESSGLAVDDGLLVTTNDSGDSGRVFTVDPATGETVGVTQWSAEPVDVEALLSADFVTFTSSSTVDTVLDALDPAQRASLRAVSIGPITTRSLRARGVEPAVEADPHDVDGLVDAVLRAAAVE